MIVSLIVAIEKTGGIGLDGSVPWHLRDDLLNFKALTMGHHLIMGRSTYESIGRLLPGRTMVVVTRNRNYRAPGCLIVNSIEDAIELARSRGETEVFVIGGAQIYAQTLAFADRLHITQVHARVECDVFFPEFDLQGWQEIERQEFLASESNDFDFTYTFLVRE